MNEIQSFWEVPAITHFCHVFRAAFNLIHFEVEELELAILQEGDDLDSYFSIELLLIRLLQGCFSSEVTIGVENWELQLQELFESNCDKEDNLFDNKIPFAFLPPSQKIQIIFKLCELRLNADDVSEAIKDIAAEDMQAKLVGKDIQNCSYWYFCGTRLYKENIKRKNADLKKKIQLQNFKQKVKKTVNGVYESENKTNIRQQRNKVETKAKLDCSWLVVCYNLSDWESLVKSFMKSKNPLEISLVHEIQTKYLPILPSIIAEAERLTRKRLIELAPKRSSSRISKVQAQRKLEDESAEEEKRKKALLDEKRQIEEEKEKKKREVEDRRKRAAERNKAIEDRAKRAKQRQNFWYETPEFQESKTALPYKRRTTQKSGVSPFKHKTSGNNPKKISNSYKRHSIRNITFQNLQRSTRSQQNYSKNESSSEEQISENEMQLNNRKHSHPSITVKSSQRGTRSNRIITTESSSGEQMSEDETRQKSRRHTQRNIDIQSLHTSTRSQQTSSKNESFSDEETSEDENDAQHNNKRHSLGRTSINSAQRNAYCRRTNKNKSSSDQQIFGKENNVQQNNIRQSLRNIVLKGTHSQLTDSKNESSSDEQISEDENETQENNRRNSLRNVTVESSQRSRCSQRMTSKNESSADEHISEDVNKTQQINRSRFLRNTDVKNLQKLSTHSQRTIGKKESFSDEAVSEDKNEVQQNEKRRIFRYSNNESSHRSTRYQQTNNTKSSSDQQISVGKIVAQQKSRRHFLQNTNTQSSQRITRNLRTTGRNKSSSNEKLSENETGINLKFISSISNSENEINSMNDNYSDDESKEKSDSDVESKCRSRRLLEKRMIASYHNQKNAVRHSQRIQRWNMEVLPRQKRLNIVNKSPDILLDVPKVLRRQENRISRSRPYEAYQPKIVLQPIALPMVNSCSHSRNTSSSSIIRFDFIKKNDCCS